MINRIDIKGFKRFKDESFPINSLTVLAGLNGAGKTSLIHALLLMRLASSGGVNDEVSLNKAEGLELGTAESVRNWASGDSIEFTIHSAEANHSHWKFGVPSDEALYLIVEKKPLAIPDAFSIEPRGFTYLCAERLGPRSILDALPLPSEKLKVGQRGEFCAQLLAILGSRPMEQSNRLHPNSDDAALSLLKYQVECWLAEIATPVEIETVPYSGSAITALQFRSPGGEWVRAPNMGFGVSYSLPIILAGLIAPIGGVIIVENPEAHLHPAGQSRMGVFLAWLAGRGVQVIVETHSDHVLNGVRRAIGEYGFLQHDKAVVNFFESKSGDSAAVQPLMFTPIGGISDWPHGFFDQYQIDVASLGRIRRGS
ncbi:MAG: DUF3696 domain-containing protein [Burkholderiaceae bacterium]|nr:DUF3696 domain-containing protein [Burkholderiaceae bacterium]